MRRRALLAASQMAGGESDNGLSDYFNVISHEDQEIAFSFDSQYNFNDGSGWHDLEMWEPVSIPKDSILYVANTDIDDTFPYPRLLGDAQNISLAGNIMSLVYGHNFREQYSLKGLVDIFTGFANKDIDSLAIKNIENLILPATELSEYCYSYMFYGCEYIKKAPELPASVLVGNCYESMFEGCSNLNYIKMLATDIHAGGLTNWVKGVPSTGTFVKHPEATWNVRGVNGVPEGWTIKFDGEEEEPLFPVKLKIGNNGEKGRELYEYFLALKAETGVIDFFIEPGNVLIGEENCTLISVYSLAVEYYHRIILMTEEHNNPDMDCYFLYDNGLLELYID